MVLGGLVLLLATAPPARAARAGVGLQVVALPDGDLVVIRVVAASPAAHAGIRPGDLLVSVAGRELAGSNLATLSREALWGPAGAPVRIRFLRPGEAGSHEVTVIREELGPVPAAPDGIRMLQPQREQ